MIRRRARTDDRPGDGWIEHTRMREVIERAGGRMVDLVSCHRNPNHIAARLGIPLMGMLPRIPPFSIGCQVSKLRSKQARHSKVNSAPMHRLGRDPGMSIQ